MPTGFTFFRLPIARAVLAGVAILMGASTSVVHGQSSGLAKATGTATRDGMRADKIAWSVPHSSVIGAVLPQPLGASDAAILRQIFESQMRGDMTVASKVPSGLQEPLFLGSILADLYLDRRYRPSVDELSDWLSHYRDLPDAPAIHALLISRLPKNEAPPAAPEVRMLGHGTDPIPEDIEPSRHDIARRAGFDRKVRERAQHGHAASALHLIATMRGVSQAYAAQLRAEVAQVLFTSNDDAEALAIAEAALGSARPSGTKLQLAGLEGAGLSGGFARYQPSLCFYIGGLAAWRLGRVELARNLFEAGGKRRQDNTACARRVGVLGVARQPRLA